MTWIPTHPAAVPTPLGGRVWADVDLDAMRRNFARIVERVSPARVMAVLKADAYGLGAVPVARALEPMAAMLGVGDSTEAIELRQAGVGLPIVVLGAITGNEIEAVVRCRIATTIHSLDRIRSLAAEARRQGTRAPVHLMVDTGMCRLGAAPPRALELLAAIHAEPSLRLVGTATHYSCAEDDAFTAHQRGQFLAVLAAARRVGLPTGLAHAANSAALWRDSTSHFDMVRPGLLLHGVDPGAIGARAVGFAPALALRTQVIYLRDVPAGTPVGYERTHVTSRPTRLATIPVGYNDGLPVRASNAARVLIGGRRAPLVGRVSMDYATVDVGHLPQVQVGDAVTLVGRDGAAEIALEEAARRAELLPYEYVCGLGKRVRRRYLGEAPSLTLLPGRGDELLPSHRPTRVDFLRATP